MVCFFQRLIVLFCLLCVCFVLQGRRGARARGTSYGGEGAMYSLQAAEVSGPRSGVYPSQVLQEGQVLHSLWAQLLSPAQQVQFYCRLRTGGRFVLLL